MPRVGFEPTIPVFEQAKTVHTLDRTTTAIGIIPTYCLKMNFEALHYEHKTAELHIARSFVSNEITSRC
jgi:hypothetical protein